mmetsp:Transcript_12458/g.26521  ORF Transcript_12458/g.26521 Transcript_12458/m.26521 type:complete len:93 (+) Transcript_12458:31-309(+)
MTELSQTFDFFHYFCDMFLYFLRQILLQPSIAVSSVLPLFSKVFDRLPEHLNPRNEIIFFLIDGILIRTTAFDPRVLQCLICIHPHGGVSRH